jgi:hypothetical protein
MRAEQDFCSQEFSAYRPTGWKPMPRYKPTGWKPMPRLGTLRRWCASLGRWALDSGLEQNNKTARLVSEKSATLKNSYAAGSVDPAYPPLR